MAENQSPRYVTHKELNGVIRELRSEASERQKETDERMRRMDDLIDTIRISQATTENELAHINKNTKRSNEIMEKFLESYNVQSSEMKNRVGALEQSFFKKHFWPLMTVALTGIFTIITAIFNNFGAEIGKLLFGQ